MIEVRLYAANRQLSSSLKGCLPLASPKALHQVVVAEILHLGHALKALLEGPLHPLDHRAVVLTGLGRCLRHHGEELVRVGHQDARAVG